MIKEKQKLSSRKKYLQIAINGTINDAHNIIYRIPKNDKIILEIGTPFIKKYGEQGIRQVCTWYRQRLFLTESMRHSQNKRLISSLISNHLFTKNVSLELNKNKKDENELTYIVADMKTIDRGKTEVEIASRAGVNAVIAMGTAPIETLDSFIEECEKNNLDSMIDMMNVDFCLSVLRKLKKAPSVVILHRGVDEEKFNKEKQLPLYEIQRIKGNYNNVLIAVAGGDTVKDVQRSFFNGANISIIWKEIFEQKEKTVEVINSFLRQIK